MSTHPADPRRLLVIGIGTGSLGHLTREAAAAIAEVDVFLVADKGSDTDEITTLRRAIVTSARDDDGYRFVTVPDPERGPDAQRGRADYERGVRDWHAARVSAYAGLIADLPPDATIGFLVWGDPAFYDSTIRIVDALHERLALQVTVFPGISAVQALAAGHRIVLNTIGSPVHVTTGRRLVEEYSPDLGTVVVMLDGHLRCAELVERHPDLQLYWGAYLGSGHETLVRGRLVDVVDEIRELRARLRAQHGWLMDTYALVPA